MDVFHGQQERLSGARVREEIRDRRLETMPLGVGVGGDRLGQSTAVVGQPGEDSRELSTHRAEIRPQGIGLGVLDEMTQRIDEGSIRRPDDGVTGTVHDEDALGGTLVRELSDEATLARPSFSTDQGDAPTFAECARDERVQRGELP
jgi:hypothetical protein